MTHEQSTWSPFQSREVREICEHLTPSEHTKLITLARQRGRDIVVWIAAPLFVTLISGSWSWHLELALVALFIIYFLVSGLKRIQTMRRHNLELLCRTEWAQRQGYTPTSVRLETFPWSK